MTERCRERGAPGRIFGRAAMAWALAALVAAFLAGCATSFDKRGVYYKVRSGDSIWRIARIYRTDVQRLAEYNNILDPKEIEPGARLYIPPRQKKASFKKLPFGESVGGEEAAPVVAGKKKSRLQDQYSKPIQVYRGRFIWPVDGRVVSAFGYRDGRRHDGVDISGSDGTPIHAAAAGKVVFAGSMRGYGNLILLRHQDDLFTAYSHNSANKVRTGQMVKQGQVIGAVGRTGRATGPHLHFELRHGQTARNPLFFLPAREGGVAYAKASRATDDSEEDDISDVVGKSPQPGDDELGDEGAEVVADQKGEAKADPKPAAVRKDGVKSGTRKPSAAATSSAKTKAKAQKGAPVTSAPKAKTAKAAADAKKVPQKKTEKQKDGASKKPKAARAPSARAID